MRCTSPCTKFPAATAAGTGQQTWSPTLKIILATSLSLELSPNPTKNTRCCLIPSLIPITGRTQPLAGEVHDMRLCACPQVNTTRCPPLTTCTNPTNPCYSRYKSPRQGCNQTERILSAPVMGHDSWHPTIPQSTPRLVRLSQPSQLP